MAVPALLAATGATDSRLAGKAEVTAERSVPIIPIIQASSSTRVSSAEDTFWPPPGGLEKQLNLWWSLGADAGVAFWVWRGSKEYPFVGIADSGAPPYALSEARELLRRIPDGELPATGTEDGRGPGDLRTLSGRSRAVTAVRVWQPRMNALKNSGFENGLEGWIGYNERAATATQAYAGHGAARMAWAGPPKSMGVGQRTDLRVPPNATVTLSCYYKVLRETSLLQWMVNTTAYPAFGAAEFLERKEHLPAGDWRRATISLTNTTGTEQRVTSAAVISNGFTGEVLLDNFQLELSPEVSPYLEGPDGHSSTDGTAQVKTNTEAGRRLARPGLRYRLTGRSQGRPMRQAQTSRRIQQPSPGWTVLAWSAPEMPPAEGSYACLAALEQGGGSALELRLRVDPRKSDRNGWAGALEATEGADVSASMPIALAPGQPIFWSVSGDSQGELTLRAAPAGYSLDIRKWRRPANRVQAVVLGADAQGNHPLNGLVAAARAASRPLSSAEIERLRAEVAD
jgi:hypothetical protein